jgi:hypothetical protein
MKNKKIKKFKQFSNLFFATYSTWIWERNLANIKPKNSFFPPICIFEIQPVGHSQYVGMQWLP